MVKSLTQSPSWTVNCLHSHFWGPSMESVGRSVEHSVSGRCVGNTRMSRRPGHPRPCLDSSLHTCRQSDEVIGVVTEVTTTIGRWNARGVSEDLQEIQQRFDDLESTRLSRVGTGHKRSRNFKTPSMRVTVPEQTPGGHTGRGKINRGRESYPVSVHKVTSHV